MEEYLNYALLVMIGLIFFDANNQLKTAKANVTEFKNGNTFRCHSGGGLYGGAETYRVSGKDGWEFDNKYFVKDSISVGVDKCEAW